LVRRKKEELHPAEVEAVMGRTKRAQRPLAERPMRLDSLPQWERFTAEQKEWLAVYPLCHSESLADAWMGREAGWGQEQMDEDEFFLAAKLKLQRGVTPAQASRHFLNGWLLTCAYRQLWKAVQEGDMKAVQFVIKENLTTFQKKVPTLANPDDRPDKVNLDDGIGLKDEVLGWSDTPGEDESHKGPGEI
jgi:hypothetical protein